MYSNVTPVPNYVLFLDPSLLNSSTVHLKPLEVFYGVTPVRSAVRRASKHCLSCPLASFCDVSSAPLPSPRIFFTIEDYQS